MVSDYTGTEQHRATTRHHHHGEATRWECWYAIEAHRPLSEYRTLTPAARTHKESCVHCCQDAGATYTRGKSSLAAKTDTEDSCTRNSNSMKYYQRTEDIITLLPLGHYYFALTGSLLLSCYLTHTSHKKRQYL